MTSSTTTTTTTTTTQQRNLDKMKKGLEAIGLERYLRDFARHGFDSWEALASASESDFDAVGVKLGHRRKLQRAHADGNAGSSSSTSSKARAELDTVRPRIYRRHPKPDKNAPNRPLTAYVRFSNDQRDVYKDNQWTFTELTRQIGHDWRTLEPERRQHYADEAEAAKSEYRKALWKYRQTAAYHEYAAYLEEFTRQNPRPISGQQSRRSSTKSNPSPSLAVMDEFADPSNDSQMVDFGRGLPEITTFFPPLEDGFFDGSPTSYASLESSPLTSASIPFDLANQLVAPHGNYPWFSESMPMDDVKLEPVWGNFIDLEAGV